MSFLAAVVACALGGIAFIPFILAASGCAASSATPASVVSSVAASSGGEQSAVFIGLAARRLHGAVSDGGLPFEFPWNSTLILGLARTRAGIESSVVLMPSISRTSVKVRVVALEC